MSEGVYVVAAKRTPIGKLGGVFSGIPAASLGASAIKSALEAVQIEGDLVSDVIMGQVLTGGAGQNPARQAALEAGIPVRVPAMTVNQVCGAGQRSIHLATQAILCGDADIIVAGGQDSMTEAPHVAYGTRRGKRMGDVVMKDSMIVDGLQDAMHDVHMGVTAERLARRYQLTRGDQDAFALSSQKKACTAIESGKFSEETTPVQNAGRDISLVDIDEHPNPATSLDSLARLHPVFDEDGTVTAGNSSGLNDGAAAVIVMSEKKVEELGLTPMARIVSYASAGVEPMDMGLGPVDASKLALKKAGWKAEHIDLLEINEAFAAQALAVNREMGWDPERINVNGGAIALGHPLAGSGCRIVATLLHEMQKRKARRGLASMCIGGGQGVAICLENSAAG